MTSIQRVRKVCKWLIYNDYAENDKELADLLGYTKSSLSQILNEKVPLSNKFIDKICEIDNNINKVWIVSGEGRMQKDQMNENTKNLIPLYEDVATIGGGNVIAELGAIYKSQVLIDLGDLFIGATAAIKHYNDSMCEYKSGSILGIRELTNKHEIEWGRNYVIETSEMRITKKIAEIDEEYIMAYSTNKETYPDGRLIHQPIKIKKDNIVKIARVLGSVNLEEFTSTMR